MKQETIKASNIATIFSWGGKKQFFLGPIMLEINAGAEKGNKYSISCHLEMDGVTKILFSYYSVLTKDEYEIANKRFAVEDILQGKDIDSIMADRVAHDVFCYFVLQSGVPTVNLTEFKDEEYLDLWEKAIHDLIRKRKAGEPLI